MPTELKDKTIWITGATSGIGQSLAEGLLEAGNRVIVSGRKRETLDQLVQRWPDRAQAIAFDTLDAAELESARAALNRIGSLDLAILCAGTCEYLDAKSFDAELCNRVMRVNFDGTCNCIELALPLLRAASIPGRLAVVASLSAYAPLPRAEAYGASKAALNYFCESLRADLAREKIEVTVVNPGFVKTPLTDRNDFPMPFLLTAEEAAEHIISGLRKNRAEIRFPRRLWIPLAMMGSMPRPLRAALTAKMVRRT